MRSERRRQRDGEFLYSIRRPHTGLQVRQETLAEISNKPYKLASFLVTVCENERLKNVIKVSQDQKFKRQKCVSIQFNFRLVKLD